MKSFLFFYFILVQCEWGPFEPIAVCSKTCGSGFQIFERNKTKEERFGGTCDGSPVKKQKCNEEPCPKPGSFVVFII